MGYDYQLLIKENDDDDDDDDDDDGFNMMLIPIDSSAFFAEVTFTFYLKSKNKGQYFLLCNGVTFWEVTFTL